MQGVSLPKMWGFNAERGLSSLYCFIPYGRIMLRFYDVDERYVQFLKTLDKQIPNIGYDTNNKFVCGVVLNINGVKYYAPISHKIEKQQTSLQIFDKGTPISTIRFSFMFPAYDDVLIPKDFAVIAKTDKSIFFGLFRCNQPPFNKGVDCSLPIGVFAHITEYKRCKLAWGNCIICLCRNQ